MQWVEVRRNYPDQWLVIEALAAHTEHNQRVLDDLAVVEQCASGNEAMQKYRHLHQIYPGREFYFVHTSRESLDIREQHRLGIRRQRATRAA